MTYYLSVCDENKQNTTQSLNGRLTSKCREGKCIQYVSQFGYTVCDIFSTNKN